MLVPHRNTANLLMQVARRGGSHSVNRRYMPPMKVFKALVDRGLVTVTREGLSTSRTTVLKITDKGREESLKLARHYGVSSDALAESYARGA